MDAKAKDTGHKKAQNTFFAVFLVDNPNQILYKSFLKEGSNEK